MQFKIESVQAEEMGVQAVQMWWSTGWLFLVDAPKGVVVCGAFDVDTLDTFGLVAAQASGTPDSPIMDLAEFMGRRITKANSGAMKLGITSGIPVIEAVEILCKE
jgi:uncharacterized protein YunC (DUF1805 family)